MVGLSLSSNRKDAIINSAFEVENLRCANLQTIIFTGKSTGKLFTFYLILVPRNNFNIFVKRYYTVYLECNCNGFSKNQKDFGGIIDYMYPNKEFFKIVSEYKDIKVIVSSDAHNPEDLDKNFDKGYQLLNELNIHPIENPLEVKND